MVQLEFLGIALAFAVIFFLAALGVISILSDGGKRNG